MVREIQQLIFVQHVHCNYLFTCLKVTYFRVLVYTRVSTCKFKLCSLLFDHEALTAKCGLGPSLGSQPGVSDSCSMSESANSATDQSQF